MTSFHAYIRRAMHKEYQEMIILISEPITASSDYRPQSPKCSAVLGTNCHSFQTARICMVISYFTEKTVPIFSSNGPIRADALGFLVHDIVNV